MQHTLWPTTNTGAEGKLIQLMSVLKVQLLRDIVVLHSSRIMQSGNMQG